MLCAVHCVCVFLNKCRPNIEKLDRIVWCSCCCCCCCCFVSALSRAYDWVQERRLGHSGHMCISFTISRQRDDSIDYWQRKVLMGVVAHDKENKLGTLSPVRCQTLAPKMHPCLDLRQTRFSLACLCVHNCTVHTQHTHTRWQCAIDEKKNGCRSAQTQITH